MTRNGIRGEFGEQVRKQRQSLGLSQEGLAERSGLHRTYISDLERGARNVSLETIARIAAGLDLAIRDLFP